MNNIKLLFTKPDTTTTLRDFGAHFWPENYQIRIVNNNITHRTEDGNVTIYAHVPATHIFEMEGEWRDGFDTAGAGFITDAIAYSKATMTFYDQHGNSFAGMFWGDDQAWGYNYPGIQDAHVRMKLSMVRPGNSEQALTINLDAFGTDRLSFENYRTALSGTDYTGGRAVNYFSGVSTIAEVGFPRLTNATAMEILSKIGFSNFFTTQVPAAFMTPGATGTVGLTGLLDADQVTLKWNADDPDYWALEGFVLSSVTT